MNGIDTALYQQAERLASRNYTVAISTDTLSDGQTVYLVNTPELAGCMAQANGLLEALEELTLARTNYIYSRLLDGKPVPPPSSSFTSTGASAATESRVVFVESATMTVHNPEKFLNIAPLGDCGKLASVSIEECEI